jgi:acetyl-CoA acyltransferase
MRQVAITGIGAKKFGKHQDRSITSLGGEGCLRAIRDANVKPQDIEVAYACNAIHLLLSCAGLRKRAITDFEE